MSIFKYSYHQHCPGPQGAAFPPPKAVLGVDAASRDGFGGCACEHAPGMVEVEGVCVCR